MGHSVLTLLALKKRMVFFLQLGVWKKRSDGNAFRLVLYLTHSFSVLINAERYLD